MKKQKKFLIQILIFLIIVLSGYQVFASDLSSYVGEMELAEDFQKYTELSDEEKEKVIAPRMYDIPKNKMIVTNPLKLSKMLGTTLSSSYSLRDVIPANMVVKNQQQTNSCWAFASLGTLESTLALMDYKNGKSPIVYDFSERHLEYATSRTFLNNVINNDGFYRKVGDGGNLYLWIPYLTNGTGAISETEMPFENNEDSIYISEIQNKDVITQVNDIITFPSYSKSEDKTQIKQQMKEHIKNYGGIDAGIHGASLFSAIGKCYNNETGAIYCDNTIFYPIDHEVIIVGWDDNYSKDNFIEGNRPENNGAWIIKNSWGTGEKYTLSEMKEYIFKNFPDDCSNRGWTDATQIPDDIALANFEKWGYTIDENNVATIKMGDDGFMYVSYEDVNIYKQLTGIINAQSDLTYENIYQYDQYGGSVPIKFNTSKIYLATIFDKKTTASEELTHVSIMAPETYTCKVYVNPNGTSKAMSDLQQVQLKAGESETFDAGYHTIEFLNPIKITGDNFVVVLEIQGTKTYSMSVMMEFNYGEFFGDSVSDSDIGHIYDNVTVESGKCFWTTEDGMEANEWSDASTTYSMTSGNWPNFDTTIKAFTTTSEDLESIESIEITTPPTKTSYKVGENFDATGMVIKAKYDNGKSEVITDYNITNGTNLALGQTSVTISYKGKTVTQAITVEAITVEAKPQNSNFDNIQGNVTRIRAYYFSNPNTKEYTIISVNLTDISIATGNEKMEYYYYLSSNPQETNIKNWVKVSDMAINDNKLSFEINTSDISNYEEVSYANDLYLYIKEVATLNNMQQEKITSALQLKVENANIEEYVDGEKKADVDSGTIIDSTPADKIDDTTAPITIPKAGKSLVMICLVLILVVVGRVAYLRYKNIQIK